MLGSGTLEQGIDELGQAAAARNVRIKEPEGTLNPPILRYATLSWAPDPPEGLFSSSLEERRQFSAVVAEMQLVPDSSAPVTVSCPPYWEYPEFSPKP